MANIIGLQKQEAALKEIQSVIKNIDEANKFMEAENPTGIITISFKKEDGKKQLTEISVPKEKVNALITDYKAEKREYVLQMARDNRIALDPEDEVILGLANNDEQQ